VRLPHQCHPIESDFSQVANRRYREFGAMRDGAARLIRRRARPQLGALRHLFLTRSYRTSERANSIDLPAP
jgi:hypothetical protein